MLNALVVDDDVGRRTVLADHFSQKTWLRYASCYNSFVISRAISVADARRKILSKISSDGDFEVVIFSEDFFDRNGSELTAFLREMGSTACLICVPLSLPSNVLVASES